MNHFAAISGPNRQCAATGKLFQPGETIHSVLIEDQGRTLRQDFSEAGWPGEPQNALAVWITQFPEPIKKKVTRFDESALFEKFQELHEQAQADTQLVRSVMAWWLVRKKRLNVEDEVEIAGENWLIVRDGKTNTRYEVINPALTNEQRELVQNEIAQLLSDAAA